MFTKSPMAGQILQKSFGLFLPLFVKDFIVKRVLVISYYWPPSGGSGVQRWVKFSKYLPAEGWQPVIYTPENPERQSFDRSLEADIPTCAEVVKRPITEIYSIYRNITGKEASKSEVNVVNHQKKSLKGRIMMWIRGNMFIPDPRVSWVRPSVKFLKEYLKEHPVDVIVSTGPPHSMHLIARGVAKATGIPWVADFRDPWTKLFYFKHLHLSRMSKRKHEKLEKAVLDDADTIVAVSPMVQEEFRQMTSTPVELITNGFDPDDFKEVEEKDGMFNLTHTGLFASDGNPTMLWEGLSELCEEIPLMRKFLRIRLCGKTDPQITDSIKEAGLESYLVDLGYQPHNIATREQMNASVLMLPLRKEPEYRATLPGKLFEYLGSMNPILGIGQSDGAMARILSSTGAGKCIDWEEKAQIKDFLRNQWQRFLDGESGIEPGNILPYSRKSTTRQMAQLLNSLTEKNNG